MGVDFRRDPVATDFLQWSVLCLSLCCCDGFGEQGLGPGGGVGVGPDTSAGSGPSGVFPAPFHTRVFARARLSASPSRSPLHLLPPVRGRPWWPERNSLLTVSPETRAAPPFKVSPGSGHLSHLRCHRPGPNSPSCAA